MSASADIDDTDYRVDEDKVSVVEVTAKHVTAVSAADQIDCTSAAPTATIGCLTILASLAAGVLLLVARRREKVFWLR